MHAADAVDYDFIAHVRFAKRANLYNCIFQLCVTCLQQPMVHEPSGSTFTSTSKILLKGDTS